MGKIFRALEKSQHITNSNTEAEKDIKAESLQDSHRKKSTPHNGTRRTDSDIRNPIAIDSMLVTGLNPQSIESEQFRVLKNNILFPEKGEAPKCIMITSAAPGDGKSFVAANLAISLSQSIDEHVLLMDCDLRAPSIHSMFGYNNMEGLSEYLSVGKPLSSLLINTFLDKLTILPAGKLPINPSELLSSEQMRRLIQEVKLRYSDRYIIIDTPPPYLTSETSVISRNVDGIVIVVKQGKTKKKDIMDIVDIYGKEKILGVVYNCANKKTGYKYGRYGSGKNDH